MDDLNQAQLNSYQQPGTSKTPTGHHVTFAMPEDPPPREANQSNPGPIRRRRFSAAKIQPTRIKKVMQSDEEIGRMVASVPVAIGRAMEHFAEKFLLASAQITQMGNCRTLTPTHMRMAIAQNPHFRFLENVLKDGAGTPGTPTAVAVRPNELAGGSTNRPLASAWKDQLTSPISPATSGVPTVQAQEVTPTSPMVTAPMGTFSPFAGPIPSPVTSPMPMSSYPLMSDPMQMMSPVDSIPLSNGAVQAIPLKSNIEMPEKPKRGRPRKVKKTDDKCLDEELCREVTDNIVKEDKDRELMPPPSLPMGAMAPRSRTKQLA